MKKALIIGISGFVGGYLGKLLLSEGYEVHGTCFGDANKVDPSASFLLHELDINDAQAVEDVISNGYTAIFHLAAQASAAISWDRPGLTFSINAGGAINVLQAIRKHAQDAGVVLVGSSEEYGKITEGNHLVDESHDAQPGNPYAVSKLAQNHLGRLYAQAYGLRIVMTRAFNHTGPGQTDTFAIPSFARQIAEAEAGIIPPAMKVGNLAAQRDFLDVRDVVRAYYLLSQKGEPGQTYNIGLGSAQSMQAMLDILLSLSSVRMEVQQDPARMRPIDTPVIVCNNNKLRQATGWQPEYELDQTLADVLEYWRNTVGGV